MNPALWASKTGLDAQQTRMAVVSNNLANVNTTGFKRTRPVFEDLLSHVNTLNGEPRDRLVRADMIYADLPSGGALFSVGSITFCGSLPHAGYDNPVSRILENVLRRFASG